MMGINEGFLPLSGVKRYDGKWARVDKASKQYILELFADGQPIKSISKYYQISNTCIKRWIKGADKIKGVAYCEHCLRVFDEGHSSYRN